MSGTVWVDIFPDLDYQIGYFVFSGENGIAIPVNPKFANEYSGMIAGKIVQKDKEKIKILVLSR